MQTAEVLIVGAGPSGLAAAITLASEGRSVIVLERSHRAGGQAGTSALIENVPPFSQGFSGEHFTREACAQCHKFGVQIEYGTEATALIPGRCGGHTVMTSRGAYHSRVVLLAVGLANRHLGVPGEDLPGVHHGMRMDALADFAGRHVVMVGGGNSAGQAAAYYLDRGAEVTILARRPLRETMSRYLIDKIKSRINAFLGEVLEFAPCRGKLAIAVKDEDGVFGLEAVDCVHIFVGQQPATEWTGRQVWKDASGYILSNGQHQTSLSGVFAVGDAVAGAVRRVTCAVGDGNRVVPSIHAYLDQSPECEVA